jgi:uncharacterized membrane protein
MTGIFLAYVYPKRRNYSLELQKIFLKYLLISGDGKLLANHFYVINWVTDRLRIGIEI